jgi:hypothetical protein
MLRQDTCRDTKDTAAEALNAPRARTQVIATVARDSCRQSSCPALHSLRRLPAAAPIYSHEPARRPGARDFSLNLMGEGAGAGKKKGAEKCKKAMWHRINRSCNNS